MSKNKPTKEQRDALRRKTSFGVLFIRKAAIKKSLGKNGYTAARNAGRVDVVSARRFGSQKEALHHGKRFKRIEGHVAFYVIQVNAKPNAWVNWNTGKTNPVIGAGRTNR